MNQKNRTCSDTTRPRLKRVHVAELLLQEPGVLNASDGDGRTALFRTADQGEVEIAKLLIESRANVNLPRKCEGKPLDAPVFWSLKYRERGEHQRS